MNLQPLLPRLERLEALEQHEGHGKPVILLHNTEDGPDALARLEQEARQRYGDDRYLIISSWNLGQNGYVIVKGLGLGGKQPHPDS